MWQWASASLRLPSSLMFKLVCSEVSKKWSDNHRSPDFKKYCAKMWRHAYTSSHLPAGNSKGSYNKERFAIHCADILANKQFCDNLWRSNCIKFPTACEIFNVGIGIKNWDEIRLIRLLLYTFLHFGLVTKWHKSESSYCLVPVNIDTYPAFQQILLWSCNYIFHLVFHIALLVEYPALRNR